MEEFSFEALVEQVNEFWSRLRAQFPKDLMSREAATELVRITRPVDPFNYSDLLAPVIGLAGMLLGLILSGVALASLGTLLVSMLALGFLLTEVYGVTLEVDGVRPPPYA
ncbi:MAG: hypothetical protein P8R42_00120 [Candidatus Binatia bacterium]|nr:hypothetical protein [Candidatus Binatia bacterium]